MPALVARYILLSIWSRSARVCSSVHRETQPWALMAPARATACATKPLYLPFSRRTHDSPPYTTCLSRTATFIWSWKRWTVRPCLQRFASLPCRAATLLPRRYLPGLENWLPYWLPYMQKASCTATSRRATLWFLPRGGWSFLTLIFARRSERP